MISYLEHKVHILALAAHVRFAVERNADLFRFEAPAGRR